LHPTYLQIQNTIAHAKMFAQRATSFAALPHLHLCKAQPRIRPKEKIFSVSIFALRANDVAFGAT